MTRWAHVTIDATDVNTKDDLQSAIQNAVIDAQSDAGDRVLALRLSITGQTHLHGQLVKSPDSFRADVCAWINEASSGMAWLEKLKVKVIAPLDLTALAARDDPFGMLVRRLDELAANPISLSSLVDAALKDLHMKVPPELRDNDNDHIFNPLSPEFQAEALAIARERLLAAISVENA